MLLLLALWVVLSLVIGIWARSRGRSKVTWALIALLVSPLIAAVLLVYARDLTAHDARLPRPSRTKRFLRIVLNILMALAVIAILISVLNRGGIKPIHIAHLQQAATPADASSPAG